jgi:hypothetical protein
MYPKLVETLKGNIAYLSTQIQPWIDQYKCKNAFELFTKDIPDVNEKIKIMGYIHRRDAYITTLNSLESDVQTISYEERNAKMKVIPLSRKWEIISHFFIPEVEKAMTRMPGNDAQLLNYVDAFNPKDLGNYLDDKEFVEIVPYLAALWYHQNVEKFKVIEEEPEPDPYDGQPCDAA